MCVGLPNRWSTDMNCSFSKKEISAYLDRAVSEGEQREVREHLEACRHCAREAQKQRRLRGSLRSLPRKEAPADLTVRLRVAASRARLEAAGLKSRWAWRDRMAMSLRYLMRPLAVPALGGIVSAVFLFSVLVPTFQPAFAMANGSSDVPLMLMTEPTVKYLAPVAFGEGDAEVDLSLDDHGHIVNYTIVSGPQSEQLRRSIENNLLFIELWPATSFGRPVSGTVRISFRSAAGIDVRG